MGATNSARIEYPYAEKFAEIAIPRWKRGLDITIAGTVLLLLSPIIAIICIGIKLLSPGPLIFRQERVGMRGRRFMCLKFRTMRVNAPQSTHQDHCSNLMRSNKPMAKLDTAGDDRLIPGAWFLRASGLDELPQLVNVLRGEMSIVGPRPCVVFEYEQHTQWQKTRFNALPGMTGLWQVSGKNMTTFSHMVRMDIQYARDQNLFTDLKIIIMTIPIILMQISDVALRGDRQEGKPNLQVDSR